MPPLPQAHYELAALARAGGDSAKNSYIAAGLKYNPSNANKLFKRRDVIARIEEIKRERVEQDNRARAVAAEESGVDLAWIERHYRHIVLAGLRGDPVRDATGKQRIDPDTGAPIYKPDRLSAVRALDSLTRMKGGFIDRTEIGLPGDFSRMADDELDAKIVESARELGMPEQAVRLLEHLTKREVEP